MRCVKERAIKFQIFSGVIAHGRGGVGWEWFSKFIIHEIIDDYCPYDSFAAIEQRRLIPL